MTATIDVQSGASVDPFDEHVEVVGSKKSKVDPAPAGLEFTKMPKVGPAPAELEFNRFVEVMNLDVEEEYLNDEDKAGLQLNRRRMLRAIEDGSLVIDGNGIPVYIPQRSDNTEPITFYEPTGASLMAMDRKKAGADVGKMFSIMADFTKTDQGRFAGLKTSDLNICMAIATLYLG